jgi:hypothetical protein
LSKSLSSFAPKLNASSYQEIVEGTRNLGDRAGRKIGVNEMTIINWEVGRMVPCVRSVRERLTREVEGVGKIFLQ